MAYNTTSSAHLYSIDAIDAAFEENQKLLRKIAKEAVLSNPTGVSLEVAKNVVFEELKEEWSTQGIVGRLFAQHKTWMEKLGFNKSKFNAWLQKEHSKLVKASGRYRKAVRDVTSDDSEDDVVVQSKPITTRKSPKPVKQEDPWRVSSNYSASIQEMITPGSPPALTREIDVQHSKHPEIMQELTALLSKAGRKYRYQDPQWLPSGATSQMTKIYRKLVGVYRGDRDDLGPRGDYRVSAFYNWPTAIHSCLLMLDIVFDVLGEPCTVPIINGSSGGLPFLVVGNNGAQDLFVVDPAEKVATYTAKVSGRTLKTVLYTSLFKTYDRAVSKVKAEFDKRSKQLDRVFTYARSISDEDSPNYVPCVDIYGRKNSLYDKFQDYIDDVCCSARYLAYFTITGRLEHSEIVREVYNSAEINNYRDEMYAATLPVDFVWTHDIDMVSAAGAMLARLNTEVPLTYIENFMGTRQSYVLRFPHLPDPSWYRKNMPDSLFNNATIDDFVSGFSDGRILYYTAATNSFTTEEGHTRRITNVKFSDAVAGYAAQYETIRSRWTEYIDARQNVLTPPSIAPQVVTSQVVALPAVVAVPSPITSPKQAYLPNISDLPSYLGTLSNQPATSPTLPSPLQGVTILPAKSIASRDHLMPRPMQPPKLDIVVRMKPGVDIGAGVGTPPQAAGSQPQREDLARPQPNTPMTRIVERPHAKDNAQNQGQATPAQQKPSPAPVKERKLPNGDIEYDVKIVLKEDKKTDQKGNAPKGNKPFVDQIKKDSKPVPKPVPTNPVPVTPAGGSEAKAPKTNDPKPQGNSPPPPSKKWKKIKTFALQSISKTVASQRDAPLLNKFIYSYVTVDHWNMAYSVAEDFWYPAPDHWRKFSRPMTYSLNVKINDDPPEYMRIVYYYTMYSDGPIMWSTQEHLPEYENILGYMLWDNYKRASGDVAYCSDNKLFEESRSIDERQLTGILERAEKVGNIKVPKELDGLQSEIIETISQSLYSDLAGNNNVYPYHGKMLGGGNYVVKSASKYYYVDTEGGWKPWEPINSAIPTWYQFNPRVAVAFDIHFAAKTVIVRKNSACVPVPRPWYEIPIEEDLWICIPVESFAELLNNVKTNTPSLSTSARVLAGMSTLQLPKIYIGKLLDPILSLVADMVEKETAATSQNISKIAFHSSLHSYQAQEMSVFTKWIYPYISCHPFTIAGVSTMLQAWGPLVLTGSTTYYSLGKALSSHNIETLSRPYGWLSFISDLSVWSIFALTLIVALAMVGDWIVSKALIWEELKRPSARLYYTRFVRKCDDFCWQTGLAARLIWMVVPFIWIYLWWIRRKVKEEEADLEEEVQPATLPSGIIQFSAWEFGNYIFSKPNMRENSKIYVKNIIVLGEDGEMDDAKWRKLATARPISHPGPVIHSKIKGMPQFVLAAQSVFNCLVALRERALRPRGICSPLVCRGIKRFYANFRVFNVEPAKLEDQLSWIDRRQPRYKALYRREHIEQKTKGFQYDKKDFEIGFFCKEETLPKLSPRIICTMAPSFNMYFGPWCAKFEKQLSIEVARGGNAVFTGGMSNAEKGSWYYDKVYTQNMWILDIDASKWDASVPDEFINEFYEFMIGRGWSDRKFMDMRRNYVLRKRFSNGADITAKLSGRFVTSGAPDTYIGNSMMNYAMLNTMVENLGLSPRNCKFMICGDDAIVGIPKSFGGKEEVLRKAISFLEYTGMEFEVAIHDAMDTHAFRFCSSFFAPAMGHDTKFTLNLVPEPVRFFGKSYVFRPESFENLSIDLHRQAVNLSGYYNYYQDPVWSRVFREELINFDPSVRAALNSITYCPESYMENRQYIANTVYPRFTEGIIQKSWEFWLKIYPGIDNFVLGEIKEYIFRHEIKTLLHPKSVNSYEFVTMSDHASYVLTRGLFPVPSFQEVVMGKLSHNHDHRDNPFAVVALLEEMDTPINRLSRGEIEDAQFRIKRPNLLYPVGRYNGNPLGQRFATHVQWNMSTRLWRDALRDGMMDSFYLRESWQNPELAYTAQWWQGEEVAIPILRK